LNYQRINCSIYTSSFSANSLINNIVKSIYTIQYQFNLILHIHILTNSINYQSINNIEGKCWEFVLQKLFNSHFVNQRHAFAYFEELFLFESWKFWDLY